MFYYKNIIAPIYKRVCALIVDNIIIFMISMLASSFVLYFLNASGDINEDYASFAATNEWYIVFVKIIVITINITYFTLTVSSKKQATLGQFFCSIYVANLNGEKITKMKAFDRYGFQLLIYILLDIIGNYIKEGQIIFSFLYLILHIILFIWYFFALFNDKRMTIHDWICKTVVLSGRIHK